MTRTETDHHHHRSGQEWPERPGQRAGPQVGRWEQYDESIRKEEAAEKFKKRESKIFSKNEVCLIRVERQWAQSYLRYQSV